MVEFCYDYVSKYFPMGTCVLLNFAVALFIALKITEKNYVKKTPENCHGPYINQQYGGWQHFSSLCAVSASVITTSPGLVLLVF